MSTNDKPKRSRKSAPKVKSGCLTWTRHLKCDEEKPICQRCRTDRFTCDGYKNTSSPANAVVKARQKSISPPLVYQISSDIAGSALERFYFHYLRQSTVGTLAFSTTDTRFWSEVVLPTAYHLDSTRHALIALGMAHRAFIDRPGIENLDGLVLQQYNAAIRHLTKPSAFEAYSTEQIVLCCLIFYCLDSVMGRYAQSLQHLRAGSKLLGSLLRRRVGEKPAQLDDIGDETLQRITDMFATIGVDAGFFLDENLIADLDYSVLSTDNDAKLGKPFSNLVDARRQLNSILVDSNNTFEQFRDDWYAPQMVELYERFRRWAARFDRTNFQFANGTPSPSERHDLTAMRLARKLWLTIIDSGLPYPQLLDQFNDLFNEVIDEAEVLLKTTHSSTVPVFTLQADIVPHVAYVCELTSDPAIQQRAIDLLRSVKRREGIWDSHEVAEYLQDYLLAKQMLPISWDVVPGGLPGSIRALRGLSLSTLNPSNNILKLAESFDEQGLGVPPPCLNDSVLMGYAQAKTNTVTKCHPKSYAARSQVDAIHIQKGSQMAKGMYRRMLDTLQPPFPHRYGE